MDHQMVLALGLNAGAYERRGGEASITIDVEPGLAHRPTIKSRFSMTAKVAAPAPGFEAVGILKNELNPTCLLRGFFMLEKPPPSRDSA